MLGTIRWVLPLAMLVVAGCGGDFAGAGGPGTGGAGSPAGGAAAGGKALASGMTGGVGSSGGASTGGAESGGAVGSGGSAPACVPGKSEACTGPGGCAGGQTCKDDGSGFGKCECSASGTGGTGGADGGAGIGGAVTVKGPDGYQWTCGLQLQAGVADPGAQLNVCECHRPDSVPDGFCQRFDCTIGACPVLRQQCCLQSATLCSCMSNQQPCAPMANHADAPVPVPVCP